MLLFVESDFVLGTKEARRRFTESLTSHANVKVALFRTSSKTTRHTLRGYPRALRDRVMVTPSTPRENDLSFCLAYEICCTANALKHMGAFEQNETWRALIPQTWLAPLVEAFDESHFVVAQEQFDALNQRKIQRLLGEQSLSSI